MTFDVVKTENALGNERQFGLIYYLIVFYAEMLELNFGRIILIFHYKIKNGLFECWWKEKIGQELIGYAKRGEVFGVKEFGRYKGTCCD